MSLVNGWHYATSQQLDATYKAEKKHIAAKIDLVEVHLDTHKGVCALAASIIQHAQERQVLTLKDQIAADFGNLQRQNLNAMCLTQKSVLGFSINGETLNFDHFGSFILSHEKVISSVRVKPEQHITYIREFQTRGEGESGGTRFDTSSIAVSPKGMAIVVDRQLDRVGIFCQKSSAASLEAEISTTVLGKAIAAVCPANGDIVFSRDKHSICIYDEKGKHKKALKDNLSKPGSLCISPDHHLYILDYQLKTVTKYDSSYARVGHVKLHYGKASIWDKIAVTSQGNVYLSSYAENCVYEFTAEGERLATYGRWGSTLAGDLYWPRGLCVDGHDNVILADTNNDRVQLLSPRGTWTLLKPPEGQKLKSPTDVAVDGGGQLLVLEKGGCVKVFEYLPY